jgi:hydroxyacylglutathione hydrolase
MRVVPIACLQDNYAYLLIDERARIAAVVDASEAEPVRAALAREQVELVAVLATHHHFDHVGGNEALVGASAGLPVYGHRSDAARTPAVTRLLDDGDRFAIGAIEIEAMHVPGHTLGALTYLARDSRGAPDGAEAWAFTGDTLFLGGCGRMFEGTPAQMHASLARLAALAPDTKIACGHEYTASNLRFATHVEPANAALAARVARVATLREASTPTVPGTVGEERATNPFLRTDVAAVRAHVGLGANAADAEPAEVFARLRREKDSFR